MRRIRFTIVGALVALALFAAGCGDDGDDGSEASGQDDTTTTTMAPTRGGVITVGQFSAPPGLDPAVLAGGGTVGGNEAAAIYDTLMRYNNETQEYEPRTAESMEPNADFSVWTLKIRPGIKFTDGTDYNADAVKFVLDRQMQSGNAAPRGQLLTFLNANSIKVVDPLTIEFTLLKPWTGFPYLFTGVAGMIYSPTAFQKAGTPQAFAANPGDAGAGPFKLKTYRAGEVIELERNPDYWGGDVNLDGIRFVLLSGPAANFEALKADQLQATFVRDPVVVRDAKEEGYGSLDMPAIAGNLLIFNSGVVITCMNGRPEPACTGQPDGTKLPTESATANLKVRQAVSHAVDPEVINDRVYDGAAEPNSAPWANSPWDPGIEGPEFDLDLAKELVAEAKAEGWDGTIRVAAGNDPIGTNWAQAVSTMLQAAGMQVAVDTSTDTQGVVAKVLVQRDWDIATWALGWLDEHDVNYLQLIGSFNTQNPRYGVTSAELESAIDQLRTAETQDDRVEAYGAVTEAWLEILPAHVISVIPQAMLHSEQVHGLMRSGASITLFHEAWYEQ